MFWVIILLLIFIFGFPKVALPIIATLAFFLLGFWVFSLFSSDPVGAFLGFILWLWVLALFFIFTDKPKKDKENDDEDI